MSLSEYERTNAIKATLSVKSNGTATDPSGSTMFFKVIKPDGTYLVGCSASGSEASRTGTGTFEYYWNTTSTDPLGIYIEHWEGNQSQIIVDGIDYGYPKIVQRKAVSIVSVD